MNEIFVLLIALLIDLIFGEPRTKFHPIAGIGNIIEILFYNEKLRKRSRKFKKIYGIFAAIFLIFLISFFIFQILEILKFSEILFIIISAIILKFTFSIRALKEHAYDVLKEIENKNIENARFMVSKIVSRDTKNLNERQIISATIESTSENVVDGFISPLFYFGISYIFTSSISISIAIAFAYRVANTLDSMIGYKNERFIELGWFSAKLDTILNFIPARISIFLFLSKRAIRIALRDHKNTESKNAGFPMSAMAGYLKVQLEKIDDLNTGKKGYKLGDNIYDLNPNHIRIAIRKIEEIIILFVVIEILIFLGLNYFPFFIHS
ncbi:MAG: cobalamin biosynthesis protein [Candidatus Altarchaeaceae archaeon]